MFPTLLPPKSRPLTPVALQRSRPTTEWRLTKWVRKATGATPSFKLGIFAGIHGDERAGMLAAGQLFREMSEPGHPEFRDFELHFYPVCNPTGRNLGTRHNHRGLDLNREFWVGSTEPEVVYLEGELRRERYDGIVALHADDDVEGCYGFVSGALLSEHLLDPALDAAAAHLPRELAPVIDGFAAERGIIKEGYPGILSAPPEQRPQALEIVFETPGRAPMDLQVAASVAAVKAILAGYRQLQAYSANL